MSLERIVLVRNVNEPAILRSLALNNMNKLGLRIMNPFELACEALCRNGLEVGNVIPSSLRFMFVYNILKNNSYFKTNKLTDSCLFVEAMDELRLNVLDESNFDKLANGEFKDKNEAILKCYKEYLDKLKEYNLVDEIMVIKRVINESLSFDASFINVSEFPLKEIDKLLLETVSNKKCETIKFNETNNFDVKEYVSAYGVTNECEYILSTIFNNKEMSFDNCTVAVAEPNIYKKTFSDLASVYNIPISFGISKRIDETSAGKLLKIIMDFMNDFYSAKAFKAIINSEFFNREKLINELNLDLNDYNQNKEFNSIIDTVGSLRISFDPSVNNIKLLNLKTVSQDDNDSRLEYFDKIKYVINMFNKGIDGLLDNYCKKGCLDNSDSLAIEEISSLLNNAITFNVDIDVALDFIFNLSVGSKLPEEGKLYVCSIDKAKQSLRKHLFVCGLSSNYYPGSPKENHILLDSDYALFDIESKSNKVIEQKKDNYYDLLKLQKANIYLTYSNYSLSDLKGQNASSLVFDTFNKLNPDVSYDKFQKEGFIKEVKYFESNLSKNSKIGSSYIEGLNMHHDESLISYTPTNKVNYKRAFSASKIVDFFKCEYKFYLTHIVGLEDPFDEDSTKVIAYNDMGTLIHSVMEHNDNFNSIEDYYNALEKEFNKYLITHPAISNELPKYILEEMKEYIKNAYEMIDKDSVVLNKESDGYATVSGVKIHGLPDLVIKLKDGRIKIVDYKVKNKIEHDPNDINTIMQILVYAYVLNSINEENNCSDRVALGEYRYLKQKKGILINDMDDKLEEFASKMKYFKTALDNNTFVKLNDDSKCKYCRFKELCLGKVEEEEEDD